MNIAVTTKKIIGTSLLAAIAGITIIVGTGNAKALFVFRGDRLDATGTVSSVAGSSFDVETSASDMPLTIVTNRRTRFTGGYDKLRDIKVGDFVTIRADFDDGDFIADRVRKSTPDSYGGSGGDTSRFVLRTAVYGGPQNDSFTAYKDGVPVQVYFDNQTEFRRGSASDLLPGAEINITGIDRMLDNKLYAERIVFVDNIGLDRCYSYGSNAIVVFNQSPLIANEEAGASLPAVPVNVPAGKYKIIGVSYDNHSGSDRADNAQKEQWLFTGLNAGATTFTSNSTKDLPTNRDFNATVLSESAQITALDQIQFKHAAYPNEKTQSIYPVCAVFKPVGGKDKDHDDYHDDRRTENRPERSSAEIDQLLPEER